MHVVLSGYFGFHNAGDEAILSAIIEQLRTNDPEIRITVLTNDEVDTTLTHGVESLNRWKMHDVFRVLKKADGLISGGGSLLQDATGPRSIIYYTTIMNMARVLRKPVYIYAQGMGPFQRPVLQKLVTYTLNRVAEITVRDTDSIDLLHSIGVKKEIGLVPDPVLGMKSPEKLSSWLAKNQINRPLLTISVREWAGKEHFIPKIAQAADQLAAEGYSIVYVPMHGSSDYDFSRGVTARMSHEAYVSPADSPIEEKMAIIAASEVLIGMRLHALIFAAVSETPFVPISYDPKIDSFAKSYGQPIHFHAEKNHWHADDLVHEVNKSSAHKSDIQRQLKEVNEGFQTQTLRTAAQALQILKGKCR